MRYKYILVIFLLSAATASSQSLPLEKLPQGKTAPVINQALNRITNGNMQGFYKKLLQVKERDSGVVNIIHIGDSHIQPDFISSVVRNNLQAFFGDAGRGLVFPYQVARSNAPLDIQSSSNTSWHYNRLAHPEIPIYCGIAGHVIKTTRAIAKINFALRDNLNGPQYFNRLKFFVEKAVSTSWMLETDSSKMPAMITGSNPDLPYEEVLLDKPVNKFTLTAHTASNPQHFYGVSLENGEPGVRVHTIGVNGAKYDQYNQQPTFWEQLPALAADLVIISLGTNEAQAGTFIEDKFLEPVDTFVNRVKEIFPGAAILITTPQDSYKGKKSNTVMRELNYSLAAYCQKNNIGLWDLYKVTNGYGSAKNWFRRGLLNKDKVHFTAAGYALQGKLLFNALARGYNDFLLRQ